MFILDTDHVSLFQRNHPYVLAHVLATPQQELATTAITVEEQLRGRLNRIRRAQRDEEVAKAYGDLLSTLRYFRTILIFAFDEQAQRMFRRLRAQGIRIGTQDLRIAAIALTQNVTLITRNRRHFALIPTLDIEDWSIEG